MQRDSLTPQDMDELLHDCGVGRGDRVALAVSGGADSMCLALMLAGRTGTVALTVDHGLRPEAASEALWVAGQMAALGLEHHILNWKHEVKPEKNIQALAREARYRLLTAWCREHDIEFLLTAHHMDDQAETVLLRLARGSGVHGLSAMAKSRRLTGNLTLVRPFLTYKKMTLIAALEAKGQSWIEDPSNHSESFERVKARRLLAARPLEGLDTDKLAETATRLRLTREAIDFYEQEWLSGAVQFFESGYALLDCSRLNAAPREVVLRGLTSVLRFASGSNYGARFEKLERLLAALTGEDFKGQTLNGARFTAMGRGHVIVTRELAAAENGTILPSPDIWDGRYEVEFSDCADGIEIRPLGEAGLVELKKTMESSEFTGAKGDMPRVAAVVLPALFQQDRLIAVPHLAYSVSSAELPALRHRWLALNNLGEKKT